MVWTNVTDRDLKTEVQRLRAAGLPPRIVAGVIAALLNERYTARDPAIALPYWKQRENSKEVRAARRALDAERRAELAEILGPDNIVSSTLSDAQRAQRYGNLTAKKIEAVERIKRDYGEMRADITGENDGIPTPEDIRSMSEQRKLIEQEELADLAAILTPTELAQYEQRSSDVANTTMRQLRGITISEEEYVALYQAQKNFKETAPAYTNDSQSFAARQAAQQQLNEQVRAVLDDDRFYAYLKNTDYNFRRLTQFTEKYPSVTPAATYQLQQIEQEVQTTMNFGRGKSDMAQLQARATDYQQRIQSLLGPEAYAAYQQQGAGRALASFLRVGQKAAPVKK